ncbi:WGxxGxxG family protein [Gorillibacterium sp. sgz500922]|uniref:WGxxGxxG family protein n=1 Tax=Gorillibacterium sp. sgz500922 TaxID=3446694 RepID=UPI003F66409B
MKKFGLALMVLMLVSGLGAGAAFGEGSSTHSVKQHVKDMAASGNSSMGAAGIGATPSPYSGNGAGMTGTGFGTVNTTQVPPYGASNGYSNYGRAYNSPTPYNMSGSYGVSGGTNTYSRNNYNTTSTNGTNPYGTGIRTNTYRARSTTNNGNWGWLGLLGLFGLAGMRSRNERQNDNRTGNKI